MLSHPLTVAALLVTVLPAVAADAIQWGQPSNGLRMSVALANREVQVTLQNTGGRDLLIPLGMTVRKPHPTLLKVFVKTPDGAMPRVIYTGIGHVAGYAEVMTIGLRASESYTVSTPVDLYHVLDGSEKLASFIRRRCQFWVELEVTESQCPNPATLDSLRRKLPCWHGKAVSNVLLR
jgi:hypothetical protein